MAKEELDKEKTRIKCANEKTTGLKHDLIDIIGTSIHKGIRYTDNPKSHATWKAIADCPEKVWLEACTNAAESVVEVLKEKGILDKPIKL